MYHFSYAPEKSTKLVRAELYKIIHEVQDLVRNHFTFQFISVGSSSQNMITYDEKSNIGFDFDFNLIINNSENHAPKDIRLIIKKAIDQVVPKYGYKYCEDSTRVLTIKK